MVKVAITARNPKDNGLRQWGLSIDNVPTGNWIKDPQVRKFTAKSGGLWNADIDISNGKHSLYFIISSTLEENGTYSGEALFDNAGFNFSGVDNDSVAVFDIIVSNGKATRAGGKSATTPPTELNVTGGRGSRVKAALSGAYYKLTTMKQWTSRQWAICILIVVGVPTSVIGALLLAKRMKKRGHL